MPDEFLRAVVDFELPPLGRYGVAMCFLPTDPREQDASFSACSSAPSSPRASAARLARGAR
jgi:glutamate synthase domain-containing protein 1